MRRQRALACACVWALVLCVAWNVVGLAHHNGPEFYVDGRNPVADDQDNDFHFRTIAAALQQFPNPKVGDTLIIAPGRYTESPTFAVDGLFVRTSGDNEHTLIQGSLQIQAERIRIKGISVDASDQDIGVHIQADDVTLEALSVYGAGTGIVISSAGPLKRIQLLNNRVYNNEIGVRTQRLRDSALRNNTIDANSQQGGLFEQSYDLTLSGNQWTLNGGTGLELSSGRFLLLENETFLNNTLHGLLLNGVSRLTLNTGQAHQNGGHGIRATDSHINVLSELSADRNNLGGILLDHGSQANTIQNSTLTAHTAANAAGIWFNGAVRDNTLAHNTLLGNRIGILMSAARGGAPASSRIVSNTIVQSSAAGILAEASEGHNQVVQNQLQHNNGHGIVWSGQHDELIENRIEQSGQSGLYLDKVSSMRVLNNAATLNQAAGLALVNGSKNNRIEFNTLSENFGHGAQLIGDQDTRLVANTMFGNHRHGLAAQSSLNLTLTQNTLEHNGDLGLDLKRVQSATVQGNTLRANNTGGIAVEDSKEILLERNGIERNLHLGLRVENATVSAKRNWWGHPLGPAGIFEGRGNAVWGMPMADLTPWLPDLPNALLAPTVEAFVLDAVGVNQALEIDVRDRSNLMLQLTGLGVDASGRRVPVSLGVLLLAEYDLSQHQSFDVPETTRKMFTVQLGGLSLGNTHITIHYEKRGMAPPHNLGLYLKTDSGWAMIENQVWASSNQISGELPTNALKPAIIALVAGKVAESLLSTTSVVQSIVPLKHDNTDLSLPVVLWFLLGVRRLVTKHNWLKPLTPIAHRWRHRATDFLSNLKAN